jgi:tRNA1(Val) A37 N6-methylase TrmN6
MESSKAELFVKCQELHIKNYKSKNKQELIKLISEKLKSNSKGELQTKETQNSLETITKSDIFTPDVTSQRMANELLSFGTLLDPCVGTGNLLKFVNYAKYDKIDVYEIKNEYLNQINDKINLNKFNCDFLKKQIDEVYDNIIVNPPYIKIQDLPVEYRQFINTNYELMELE